MNQTRVQIKFSTEHHTANDILSFILVTDHSFDITTKNERDTMAEQN